jgi:hypothetical protein
MPSTRCIAVILAACSSAAVSQTAPEFAGHWSAKSVSPKSGAALVVDLVLTRSESSWTYTPIGGKDNPCYRKAFPVTVLAQAASALKLQVDGSKALEGCPDFVVEMERIDTTTYQAHFTDGRSLKFSRSP